MILKRAIILLVFFGCCTTPTLFAQRVYSSDELFAQARSAAFDKKEYPKGIVLSLEALEKSPDYHDIRIFLGRLYAWSHKYVEAKGAFQQVLVKDPSNEDASIALIDLEYWNDHNEQALALCDAGLKYRPDSEELLLRKAKILNATHRYSEAYEVALGLVEKHPKNDSARSLLQAIRFDSVKNKVGISHDFTWFDGNYASHLHDYPWHIVALDYGRNTSMGSVIARLNYGNRFGNDAIQFEMDAYPRLIKNVYAYVNFGISDHSAVFPRFRTGLSLYASLPHSFEAEAGFRLLHFSNDVWIYVGSISKYYKNFWFNGRVYLVPGNNKVSHSYTLTTRYYTGGVDDYWKFAIGYGLSPDDSNSVQGFTSDYKLKSAHVTLGFKKSIHKFNVIGFTVSGVNQEFNKGKYGNQINTSLSYARKF